MIDPSWAIPVAGQAVKNREDIAGAWASLVNFLLGTRSQLAVTGMPGTGKTVLLDHLTGRAADPDYTLPGKSAQLERETLKRTGQRLGLAAIPGQAATSRLEGLDRLFLGKDPVAGILHVVSFGFTETRGSFAKEAMEEIDLPTLRRLRLEQELEDLEQTCGVVRSSWTRHRHPLWMLVVANKVDLYSSEEDLNEARKRYSERSNSDFAELLNELQAQIGKDNFEWQALPGCSWLEDFRWRDEVVESKLDLSQRNELLRGIADAAASRCKGARLP